MAILPVHWYYNTETGQLTQGNNIENLGNNVLGSILGTILGHRTTFGWHELNIPGNASAAAAAAAATKEFPGAATPTTTGITAGRIAAVASQEAGTAINPGDWLKSLTGWVGQQNIWLRGAEIVAGLMILYIGLKAVTAPASASARQIGKGTVRSTASNVRKVVTHV
jgi:hypothetical protein